MKKKWKANKTDGGAHIYILGMMVASAIIMILLYLYWNQMANISFEKIDTATTSSLLSAIIPNIEASYASTTGIGLIISSSDYIDSTKIGTIEHDPLLNACYDRFLSALKMNMNLNENLESSNPMMHGEVQINYLRIYEVKKLNAGGYRITQHLYRNGSWIVENIFEGGTLPGIKVKNTWSNKTTEITRTSLEAEIMFWLYKETNGNKQFESGEPLEDIAFLVKYKRVVEIKDDLLETW